MELDVMKQNDEYCGCLLPKRSIYCDAYLIIFVNKKAVHIYTYLEIYELFFV